jgi:AraC family transcriptional regulator of adaptative response/methylated-DNA-[protein]-cysteine methyltransferase
MCRTTSLIFSNYRVAKGGRFPQFCSMNEQLNFDRITVAIEYLKNHFTEQPDLDEVARQVHLSRYHFQRLFTEWAGVSPKKFIQYLTIEYAKELLKKNEAPLLDVAYDSGLSGTGRLHDLFTNIEGMTPGEYKNGGAALTIHHSFAETPFGDILVASTHKGICHMAFADDRATAYSALQQQFPNAAFVQMVDRLQQNALCIFNRDFNNPEQIRLHLKGTAFQLKVWQALLKIPTAGLSTYSRVATHIDQAGAVRAVGTAIARNPVAFIIPCHRVIQSSGQTGQYHWGTVRKMAIIGWESGQSHK